MCPNFYELVLDLFGISFPPFKLMQSYGMMVALGFVVGSILMSLELKRKEDEGLLQAVSKKAWKGKRSTLSEKVIYGIVGFVFGFKLIGLYSGFESVTSRPADYLLSMNGSMPAGIICAVIAVVYLIWHDRAQGLDKPMEIEELVHPHEHIGNFAILAGIGAVVGGKLFHNLENWDDVVADPMGALTSFSGLSFFGGMILSIALLVWYARKNKIGILHLMDAGTPALAIGYGFGRLGCQVSGDGDWGIPNDNPMPDWLSFLPDWMWAYNYPNNVLGVDMVEYFADKGYTSLTGYAYPTPVYEIIMSIFIFAFLWSMRKKWTIPGTMLSVYFVLSGIERLLIEQIRINNEYDILGGITQAEIISVCTILVGALGVYYTPKYGKRWAKW